MMSKVVLKEYVRVGYPGQTAVNEYGSKFVQVSRGPKIGVMVANEKKQIGWSLLSEKEDLSETIDEVKLIDTGKGRQKKVVVKTPVWTSQRVWDTGTRIALERADGEAPFPEITPRVIQRALNHFKSRVENAKKGFVV
jgi:hypothetical protein